MNPCRFVRIVTAPARTFINAVAQLFENGLHDFDPLLPDTDCALLEAEHEVLEPASSYTYTVGVGHLYTQRLWEHWQEHR